MATKKTTKKTAGRAPAVIDDSKRGTRPGGRVPSDEERAARGQIRRTLRVSDAADAADFVSLEDKHGGTSGALRFLLGVWRGASAPTI